MAVNRCAACLRENPPQYLTVDECARLLRVSAMTVYRLIESGGLKHVRVGRTIRVQADDFDAYLRDITAA